MKKITFIVLVYLMASFSSSSSETPRNWEYKVINLVGRESTESELNRYGASGWELVTAYDGGYGTRYTLKRPR